MKKFSFYTIVVFILICTHAAQAQRVYKQQQIAEYVSRLTSNESAVKQMVHEAFASQNEVTVMDFSKAVSGEAASYKTMLGKYLRNENMFSITDAADYLKTVIAKPEALTVVLPYKNKQLIIDLVKADIFSDDFKVFTDKNPEGLLQQTSAFYRGIVRGGNASATISFFADQVEGYITLDNNTTIEITRIINNNKSNTHVVYSDEDLLVKGKAHYCTELHPPGAEFSTQSSNKITTAPQFKCVTNYWETAYSVYKYFGNTNKVSAFLTSLFNVYATLYANEKIGMKLNATYIWTTQDPYKNSLSTFSSLRTNYGANTAVLFSDSALGGVAWLNTICQTSDYYRHAFCGSINLYESVLPITSYSWPVMVSCHEVGHNLGSPHTHACAWNGNNTAIDGCGPLAGYNEGCNGPIPQTGGTVMSYCHLVSVGINLTKGFGKQPGDLIRHNIDSCITLTCPKFTKACNPPTNVVASSITKNSALIDWAAVKAAAYYYVYISADSGKTFTLAADRLYATFYKLTALQSNVQYICDVWVACAGGLYNSTRIYFNTAASFTKDFATNVSANAFTVIPNPVHDNRFTVSLKKVYENALVQIINSSNQLVYESRGNTSIRSFAAPKTKGLYYVRIILEGEILSDKILVE